MLQNPSLTLASGILSTLSHPLEKNVDSYLVTLKRGSWNEINKKSDLGIRPEAISLSQVELESLIMLNLQAPSIDDFEPDGAICDYMEAKEAGQLARILSLKLKMKISTTSIVTVTLINSTLMLRAHAQKSQYTDSEPV